MRYWTRAIVDERCGGPHRELRAIAKGEAMQVFTMAGVTKRFVRCVDCVGPPPPDIWLPRESNQTAGAESG